MNETDLNRNRKFSDFLSVIYKWKKFLIINLIIVSIIAIVVALLIDNEYKSSGTVIITSGSTDMGLTSMFSDVSALLGVGKTSSGSTEYLLGILGSRELKLAMIKKFGLVKYYEYKKYKIGRTIKRLETEYFFELNENGMINISFIHKDPKISAHIVDFIINYADSVNNKLHKEKAKHYREFIEGRYDKANHDLDKAELDMKKFQEQSGLFVVPDQIIVNIKSLVELEKNLYAKKTELEILLSRDAPNKSRIDQIKKEIKIYSNNLEKIKTGNSKDSKLLSFLPTDKLPTILSKYFSVYRNLEIQKRILETLTPLYEQALMDENKNTPSLLVLDPPFIPELKSSPKRSVIVIVVFLLSAFFLVPIILIGESVITQQKRNLFDEKLLIIYRMLIKIYKLKI